MKWCLTVRLLLQSGPEIGLRTNDHSQVISCLHMLLILGRGCLLESLTIFIIRLLIWFKIFWNSDRNDTNIKPLERQSIVNNCSSISGPQHLINLVLQMAIHEPMYIKGLWLECLFFTEFYSFYLLQMDHIRWIIYQLGWTSFLVRGLWGIFAFLRKLSNW